MARDGEVVGEAIHVGLQRTLGRPVSRHGVGLRGGKPAMVVMEPAGVGTGRVFVVGGVPIPARAENVVDTRLATTLGVGWRRVGMVEHLCAALHALGVDNVRIVVEGDEVPALDGSAVGWVGAIAEAGTVPQDEPRRAIVVTEAIRVSNGEDWAEIQPADRPGVDVTVLFPHPLIGRQRWAGDMLQFSGELAWARTFGFMRDAEQLRDVARGVSLANTVVYGDAEVLNPEGLRAADEAVRHKALDAVGDLSLVGAPVMGRLRTFRGGHRLHAELVRRLGALG
jgi:UDP-3-O-[3-hydroxymyristoyl] N-acetylglucosamine deacetylase